MTSIPDDKASLPTIGRAALRDGRLGTVRTAVPADAAAMVEVIHAAFGARRPAAAAPDALKETRATLTQALMGGLGFVAEVDGVIAGVTLTSSDGSAARLGRVSVHPDHQGVGLAGLLVRGVCEDLAARGVRRVNLLARQDFPELKGWWEAHGWAASGEERGCWVMSRRLPVVVDVPDADAMRALGRAIAALVSPGDVLIASGELGAGKTTFTQGLGEGMAVTGPILSPTFVLARVHRSETGGPALVHADAYRLGGFAELEDLDLEESLADSVTLIEWGEGLAEALAAEPLVVSIERSIDPADETRQVSFDPRGTRWSREALLAVAAAVRDRA